MNFFFLGPKQQNSKTFLFRWITLYRKEYKFLNFEYVGQQIGPKDFSENEKMEKKSQKSFDQTST
jgi:hypothetical protein